jgi:Plasmid pRiA4b ORF-3-like protein
VIPFGPTVHTLKVTLREVKPAVWRRVVVRSEMPLAKFARTLEAAMGSKGYHLHMFDVGGVLFGTRDDDADYIIDERQATVKQVLPRLRAKLRWDYDFGDSWEHNVVVEAIESPTAGQRYPTCIGGSRACPPEDCGGVGGYARLLEALVDPTDSYVEWAPDGFDPAVFDLVAANQQMRGR